jgi:hypothetical protein
MSTRQWSWIFCAAALSLAGLLSPPSVRAQNLSLVARFSAFNGTVYFLPGAWVSIQQDDQSTYYRYEKGKFVRTTALPEMLRSWKSFDWADDLDSGDQVTFNYDPELDKFLPRDARVKKVEQIALGARGGKELYLICFTQKTTAQTPRPSDTDIYVAAVLGSNATSEPRFTKLWIRKLETDAFYGEFTVQNIPNLGQFILLYWGDLGGSGGQDAMNVYRITE